MNVFEDLIEELRQENLLETTVIDNNADRTNVVFEATDETAVAVSTHDETPPDGSVPASAADDLETSFEIADEVSGGSSVEIDADNDILGGFVINEATAAQPLPKRPDREFFNKRALAEMSSLQMVDHVLTGVEREYLKVIPKPYDDFKAKIALNSFLQVTEDAGSEAHKNAEFNLIQETEQWCSALAERDSHISVAHLRQFCENTRPALSSQAMLAIGKFYRNLPYSESVRAKFDFVITRLFSKPTDDDRRLHIFSRDETIDHIKRLYAEWASIPLYSSDENDTDLTLAALSFEELTNEAENASRFDQLIENDFFGRLRAFKESISETFFAPSVIASAINANIKIGNRYVELLAKERDLLDADSIAARYAHVDSGNVSDAAGRSLDLVGTRRERSVDDDYLDDDDNGANENGSENENVENNISGFRAAINGILERGFEVDRWVIVFASVILVASLGVFVWGNYFAGESINATQAATVDLNSDVLREHAKVVKKSGDSLYVQMQPSWTGLPKDTKSELLGKYFQAAKDAQCEQVILLDRDGKTIAFGNANRLDVNSP